MNIQKRCVKFYFKILSHRGNIARKAEKTFRGGGLIFWVKLYSEHCCRQNVQLAVVNCVHYSMAARKACTSSDWRGRKLSVDTDWVVADLIFYHAVLWYRDICCCHVSVCHKPVLYRNDRTNRAGFWHEGFLLPIPHTVLREFGAFLQATSRVPRWWIGERPPDMAASCDIYK